MEEEEEGEFQEADIVFVDRSDADLRASTAPPPPRRKPRRRRRRRHGIKSAPIDVQLSLRCRHDDDGADTDGDGSSWEVTVPPHVLVGRRAEEKLACSVCTGHGRTLKGRDLLSVRTAVLRMTGYYER